MKDLPTPTLMARLQDSIDRAGMGNPDSSFDLYQRLSQSTAGDTSLTTLALGLAGEAGEVADLVKKHIGHGHILDGDKLAEELGDVLWYVAMLAEHIDWDLSAIAGANREKLQKRYPEGFSAERSRNRGNE